MANFDVNVLIENPILKKYFAWLESKSKAFNLSLGLLCLSAIVLVDWYHGVSYNFGFLYMFPVAFTTWFAGKRCGAFVAAIASLSYSINSELFFDTAAVWNAAGTFAVLSAIGILVSTVRTLWEKEQLLSQKDHLTGLLNSRAFLESLDYEICRYKRSPAPFSLAYIDLDSFKEVNDTYGHQRGDELLKSASNIMRSALRATDLASRMGGDEFAILFPNTDIEQIRVVEDKFRRKFATVMEENHWPTSLSMGVVTFNSSPSNSDDAIKLADNAMYRAKHSGKNRTEFVEV
jgi:diguanylate cyclase (GGDEF)-like protein